MSLAGLLRGTAILIAVAALVDPVVTVTRRQAPVVTMAVDVSEANREAGEQAAARLRSALGGRASIDRLAEALPLACDEPPCVAIVDGSHDPGERTRAEAWHVVRVEPPAGARNVAVEGADLAPTASSAASGTIAVSLLSSKAAGATTRVQAFDAGVLVGAQEHRWGGEARARVVLAWWPVATGARMLRIEARTDGDAWPSDDAVQAGVDVSGTTTPVLVFEPRASWPATFVRRALESDPRLRVASRSRLGPTLSTSTPAARLDARSLDGFPVVVVGAPGDLSQAEAALLDRYVTVRGGTLVLLPDVPEPGAAARWLGAGWRERVSARPRPMGALRASEYLVAARPGPMDRPLAASDDGPTVVLSPVGEGRVIVSGAMDAWRYRDDPGQAFGRFWQGVIADAAPLGAPLVMTVASAAEPGGRLPLLVRRRAMEAVPEETMRATLRCADGAATPLRLWPAATGDGFEADLRVGLAGPCVVGVAVEGGPTASRIIAVADRILTPAPATLAAWMKAAAARGSTSVAAGGEGEVADAILAALAPPAATGVAPMRSAWWLPVFACSLGGEWWLRRRRGLR